MKDYARIIELENHQVLLRKLDDEKNGICIELSCLMRFGLAEYKLKFNSGDEDKDRAGRNDAFKNYSEDQARFLIKAFSVLETGCQETV